MNIETFEINPEFEKEAEEKFGKSVLTNCHNWVKQPKVIEGKIAGKWI